MNSRVRILLLLLSIAVTCLFILSQSQPRPRISLDPGYGVRDTPLNTRPLGELATVLREMYTLRPDRRVLRAVEKLPHVLRLTSTTPESKPVSVQMLRDGEWQLVKDDIELGVLPELPLFEDIDKLLSTYAESLASAEPKAVGSGPKSQVCSAMRGSTLLISLHELEKQASTERVADVLVPAARCYSLLALQAPSFSRRSDPLVSQALAVVYLAQALSSQPLYFERGLLAHVLGFDGAAIELARKAGKDGEEFLAYLLVDRSKLDRVERSGSELSQYLALRAMKHNSSAEVFFEAAKVENESPPPLYVVDAGFRLQQFTLNRALPAIAYHSIDKELSALEDLLAVAPGKEEASLLTLYKRIKAVARSASGTMLDAHALEGYFVGHLFDTSYVIGDHLLFQLYDRPGARDFVEQMLAEIVREIGDEDFVAVSEWIESHNTGGSAEQQRERLLQVFSREHALGGAAFQRTMRRYSELFRDRAGERMTAVARFAEYFDARPDDRDRLASFLFDYAADIRVSGRLWKSLIAISSDERPSARAAQWRVFLGEYEPALKILAEATSDPEMQLKVAKTIRSRGAISTEAYGALLESLVEKFPEAFSILSAFTSWRLARNEDLTPAVQPLKNWIASSTHRDLQHVNAVNQLTEILWTQGKFQEAYELNSEVVSSQHGNALLMQYVLLRELGKEADAEATARRIEERYRGDLTAILPTVMSALSQEDFARAATALESWAKSRSDNSWASRFPRFFELALRNKDIVKKQEALKAISRTSIFPLQVAQIPIWYSDADRFEEAFELIRSMEMPIAELRLTATLEAYENLKKARGKAAASQWLKTALSPEEAAGATIQIYRTGDYELLWDLVSDEGNSDFVWLPRAMASLAHGWDATPYKERLLERYRAGGNGMYFVCGAFLLDLASREECEASFEQTNKRAAGAFYLGLKEESRGNLSEAHDWFRIAIELDNWEMPESAWARDHLNRFTYADFAQSNESPS